MDEIVRHAVADARTYERAAFDAVEIENYGDLPFTKGRVEAVTVAAMTRAALAVREAVKMPVGLNVLRNDALSALAIAAVVGARFIRVNVLTGAMLTDQGIIEGNAYEVQRLRTCLFGRAIENRKSKIRKSSPTFTSSMPPRSRHCRSRLRRTIACCGVRLMR